jgi:6-methylsalicylic acid synthase
LKRLNQAIADGDHVLAVLKGSAVCSDGKTVCIIAPNPYAQQLVARRALSAAGIAPDTVQYIEAHATSTSLGDTTEAGALAEVYGAESGRDQSTVCYIGSVKPNIGHLEAGAGAMGLIKAVMVLQNNLVPPQANLQTLNRKIDWKRALLHPCMEPTPLPHSSPPARAAIASYGYSGTVSHAIIDASPFTQNNITSRISTNPVLLLLSAPQSNRLPATAATLRKWLDEKHTEPDFSLEEVATTLASHRNHHRFRLAIAATSVSEAITALDQVALDVKNRYVIQNRANPSETTKDPVWVFSGHGAQWPNMGKEL